VKIFLKEFLFLWPEDLFQDSINFYEMAKLDHSISLIKDQIFEVLKVQNFILQKFRKAPWSSYDNLRHSLPNNSELFLL